MKTHPLDRPPVTLDRIYAVIFSHVSPLQSLAILEDLEALGCEMPPLEPLPPGSPQLGLPASNCVMIEPD